MKIHEKFGNFFIVDGEEIIAMCTSITSAKIVAKKLEAEELENMFADEAKGQDLPCDGCTYYHKGSHDCMLDAPNNCIRQAEDFYTKAEPKGNRPQEGK